MMAIEQWCDHPEGEVEQAGHRVFGRATIILRLCNICNATCEDGEWSRPNRTQAEYEATLKTKDGDDD